MRPPTPSPSSPLSRTSTMLRRLVLAATLAVLVACGGIAGPSTQDRAQASAPESANGDVILNLFQWTWDSVAAECTSTIGPAGFGYVQVSPPQETIQGPSWWTSYQPVSYKIEGKLGTRSEFANMVSACNDAGVGVIADAVINHTTGADGGSGTGTAGSSYGIDDFPGIYDASDFNDCHTNITDYQDRYQVQNCRLVSLQDLRTGSPEVQSTLVAYFDDLIDLGVSGFRIDAAKHIPAEDLASIKSQLSDPDVYWVQEVIGAAGEPIQPEEYLGTGDVHEFDYARQLKSDFDGSIANLKNISSGKLPSESAGVFVDNHDTERNGETMNAAWGAKYILANTFMLSYPYGSPSVYSGYTFTDKDAGAPGATATSVPDADCASSAWTCTQRWTEIQGMVGFHNEVSGTEVTDWWDDGGDRIAFGRGTSGYVAINNSSESFTRTYDSSLPAGEYCDVIASDDCSETITVAADGTFTATLPAYGALALHVGALSDGTGGGSDDGGSDGGGEEATATAVSVSVQHTTTWGQNVFIVGSAPELGSWSPASAIALSSADYPRWTASLTLPANSTAEYKYIVKNSDGSVTWESGANRTLSTGSSGTVTLQDTWS